MGDFDRGRSGGGGGGSADPDWDRTTQEFLRSISKGSNSSKGEGVSRPAEVIQASSYLTVTQSAAFWSQ